MKNEAYKIMRILDNESETQTVSNHSNRPYQDLILVMQEIVKSAPPVHDASGKDVIKWVVEGTVQIAGKFAEGTWELVLNDKTQKILHFLFKS